MAKRRSLWAKAAQGLGEGIGDASSYLLRQRMQDRSQDRYDERARRSALAVADRQEQSANRTTARGVLDRLEKGEITEEQTVLRLSELGINVNPGNLKGIRPSLGHRLGPTRKAIDAATSLEGIPSDESIASEIRAAGGELPWASGMLPPDSQVGGQEGLAAPDLFANMKPEGQALQAQAGARRRAFREKPSERIESKNLITGAPELSFSSPYDYTEPTPIGPTAEQAGALAGGAKVAELGVSGGALASQAGKEAKAKQDVEMAPGAVNTRVNEDTRKEVARIKARFPFELDLAKQKAAIDISAAVNKDQAVQTANASRASAELAPFMDKVTTLTARINTQEGTSARVVGLARRGAAAMGDDPDIVSLNQLIAQNLRRLAVASGVREANVSEKEAAFAFEGIGLYAWSTATERRNALRNLNDLITIGPTVANRLGPEATIGERAQLAVALGNERRKVEQDAIQAGFDYYLDPVSRRPAKVIR